MNNAIELVGVTAGYRGREVLRDLSMSVGAGELAAVIGPNGAGKTTLLRILTALVRPTSGGVRVFGEEIATVPAARRARLVGVVPQDVETPMAYSVEEIVALGLAGRANRWSAPSAEDRQQVEQAMVYTDVADLRRRPFGELSAGERQRAVIAMVLAQQPRMILMDEPTSHLDLNHRVEVMEIVERLNRQNGVTVLLVSHDLNLAAEFCQRLFLLEGGCLAASGSPREVLREDLLRRVYGCDVRVHMDEREGTMAVAPVSRRFVAGYSGQGVRVHVIAGGGRGEEVLRSLCLCGFGVVSGVLNRGDSDAEVADALGVEVTQEQPFSPVSGQALQAARQRAVAVDAVVLCGVPFGPGNVANLQVATDAMERGRPVFVMEGWRERDYTPGKEAVRVVSELLQRGAREWRNVAELLRMLPHAEASRIPESVVPEQ